MLIERTLGKRMLVLLAGVMVLCAFALCALAGCAGSGSDSDGARSSQDPDTLTVTLMANRTAHIVDALEDEFPDINFEVDYYQGENMSGYMAETIKRGYAGDIVYYTQLTKNESVNDKLLDLSGYAFMGNINDEVLNMLDVDGRIYQVPGPLEVRCIIYNKTLFAENGWEAPTNFQELVALCRQIRQDEPDITPIAMSLGGEAYPFTAVATLSQCGFLSTPEGVKWEQDFWAGEASIEAGMSEGLAMMEQLIDARAFDPEPYIGKWNCNDQMIGREAAMEFHWANMLSFMQAANAEDVTDEFGFIPFYGMNEGEKLVGFSGTTAWGINEKLGEKGSEAKLENALRVMEWLVSVEGQQVLSNSQGQFPVTKGASNELVDRYMNELWEIAQNGYTAGVLYSGYEHVIVECSKPVKDAMIARSSAGMSKEFVETGDRVNGKFLAGDTSEAYGVVERDFTNEETSQMQADALLATGLGDFALVTHSDCRDGIINGRGAAGHFFEGAVTLDDVRMVTSNVKSHVVTIGLTGAQVKELLETGKVITPAEEGLEYVANTAREDKKKESASFEYYWSGLDVDMEDGVVRSAMLNGAELDDAATYDVVFMEEDYVRALGEGAVVSDVLVLDMLVDYVTKNAPLSPPEVLRG